MARQRVLLARGAARGKPAVDVVDREETEHARVARRAERQVLANQMRRKYQGRINNSA